MAIKSSKKNKKIKKKIKFLKREIRENKTYEINADDLPLIEIKHEKDTIDTSTMLKISRVLKKLDTTLLRISTDNDKRIRNKSIIDDQFDKKHDRSVTDAKQTDVYADLDAESDDDFIVKREPKVKRDGKLSPRGIGKGRGRPRKRVHEADSSSGSIKRIKLEVAPPVVKVKLRRKRSKAGTNYQALVSPPPPAVIDYTQCEVIINGASLLDFKLALDPFDNFAPCKYQLVRLIIDIRLY